MKYLFFIVLSLIACLTFCEDVIEVDLPTGKPRLIDDALMRVDTTQEYIPVVVKVTQTNAFFKKIPVYEGRKYIAQTRYVRSGPITGLKQGEGTLFSEDETEVVVAFVDNPNIENFYVFDFDFNGFLATEDNFYNGQEFEFSYFYNKELESGRELTISVLGADSTFYNYMNQLVEQSEGPQGPFQTPAATVLGNVFDITDLDNQEVFDNVVQAGIFPLGYLYNSSGV